MGDEDDRVKGVHGKVIEEDVGEDVDDDEDADGLMNPKKG